MELSPKPANAVETRTASLGLGAGWRSLLAGLMLCSLLASPVFAGKKKEKESEPALPAPGKLVWPQPPQQARVAWSLQITGVQDIMGKPKRSWMDKAAGAKPKDKGDLRLQKPWGVAADSKGRIFVADPASRAVFVFDIENKQVQLRGTKAPAQMALPVGVAIDERDRLFVTDSFFHQVTCFAPEGEVLGVFGSDELVRPGGLAVDNARHRLYVADAKKNQIAVFDTEPPFKLLRRMGDKSTPEEPEEGKFSAPTNVAVDANGSIYVTDTWNFRVQVFDADGKFVRLFGKEGSTPGSFRRPKGIAVDSDGHVLVADSEFNNFQILSPEGRPLLAVGGYGTDPGQFAVITGVAVDKRNRIYVTDQWKGRVQVFQYLPDQQVSAKK